MSRMTVCTVLTALAAGVFVAVPVRAGNGRRIQLNVRGGDGSVMKKTLATRPAPRRPGARPGPWKAPKDSVGRWYNRDGRLEATVRDDKPALWKRLKLAPSATPPGVLVSVPAHPRSKITIDPDDFKSPGPNAGTIHPDARVVRITRGKLTLAIAFDAASPKAAVIDRVRLDFTGQGNFVNAPVVVRYEAWSRAPERLTLFRQRPMNIVVGGRKLTIAFECSYGERDRPGTKPLRSAELHIGTAAQGKCRFGNTVREVLVTDGNGNLTLNDPGKPVRSGALENARGDRLRVDIGTGDFKYALYGLYDNPVLVAGRLYDVIVSDDGAKIHAKPYTGKIGYVRIAHPEWRGGVFRPAAPAPPPRTEGAADGWSRSARPRWPSLCPAPRAARPWPSGRSSPSPRPHRPANIAAR